MDLLTVAQQAMFKSTMRDAHDTFAKKPVTWRRLKSRLQRYGEDDNVNGYDDVTLMVLPNYNYMRSWPIEMRTETGDLDRQSVQLLINKDYLRGLGYVKADNMFDYDPSQDRWVIDGLTYVAVGDTPVSCWTDDDILFTVILKRDEIATNKQP